MLQDAKIAKQIYLELALNDISEGKKAPVLSKTLGCNILQLKSEG